jgi:hypothetical protein
MSQKRTQALAKMQSMMDQTNAVVREWFREMPEESKAAVIIQLLTKHSMATALGDTDRSMELGLALCGLCNLLVSVVEAEQVEANECPT